MRLENGVLFDVDGTLIDSDDRPRNEVIAILDALHNVGTKICVWSGGGGDYVDMWMRRLGLDTVVAWTGMKGSAPPYHILFTVDDVDTTDFGVPNLLV